MHTLCKHFLALCLGFMCTLTLFHAPVQGTSFNFIELKDYKVIAVEGLTATKNDDNKISFAKGTEKLLTLTVGKGNKEQFASYFTQQNSPSIIFTRKEVRLDNGTALTAFTVEYTNKGRRRLILFAADGYFLNVTTYKCTPQLPFILDTLDSENKNYSNIFRFLYQQKYQGDGDTWEAWLSAPRKALPKFEAKVSMLDKTMSIATNLRMEHSKAWQVSEVKNFCVITPQKGSEESDVWLTAVPYATPQDAGLNEHFYDTMRSVLDAAGIANTTRGRYYGGEYNFYTSTGGMGSAGLVDEHALIIVERNLGCSSQMADYFRTFLRKNYEPVPPVKSMSAEDIAALQKAAPTDPATIKQLQNDLMHAVRKLSYDDVEKILQSGIDVNFLMDGYTPLARATQKDAVGTMALLLKYGAHVDGIAQNHTNWTPLGIAVYNNSIRAAQYLLQHKADVHLLSHEASPLIRAMMGDSKDKRALVQLLLDHGADPNRAKQYALNPVQFAVMNAKAKYLPLLLIKGGNIQVRDQYQKSLLMLVAEMGPSDDGISEEDKRKTMQILINHKADIHAVDDDGNTALMLAARYAVKENVELLLKNGANPNTKNNQGQNALYFARKSPMKGIVAVLRKYGAK